MPAVCRATSLAGNVFPPVVFFLEAQNLTNLAVGKRRFELAKLPNDRGIRSPAAQKLTRRHSRGDGVVDGVEHLEAEAVGRNAKVDDLPEIAGVDVAPGIAFARGRI